MNKTTAPAEVSGTITSLIRRTSSLEGNPKWTVVLADGTRLTTRVNAAVAYEITNSDFQGVPVVLTLSGARTVTAVRLA